MRPNLHVVPNEVDANADRETAVRMANALFCFCVMASCRATRAAVYREIGATARDIAALDAEAVRLFRLQIVSTETDR